MVIKCVDKAVQLEIIVCTTHSQNSQSTILAACKEPKPKKMYVFALFSQFCVAPIILNKDHGCAKIQSTQTFIYLMVFCFEFFFSSSYLLLLLRRKKHRTIRKHRQCQTKNGSECDEMRGRQNQRRHTFSFCIYFTQSKQVKCIYLKNHYPYSPLSLLYQ